jgi:hypothetical protein
MFLLPPKLRGFKPQFTPNAARRLFHTSSTSLYRNLAGIRVDLTDYLGTFGFIECRTTHVEAPMPSSKTKNASPH